MASHEGVPTANVAEPESPPTSAPPIGFARVVGFREATVHLSPTDSDQLVTRITKEFEALCRNRGAEIYSAGDCDFVMFTTHLSERDFDTLSLELIEELKAQTPEFQPPLELVIGHAGPKPNPVTANDDPHPETTISFE